MSFPATTLRRIATMLCLILAGEAIFTLPFHVSRFFGVTFLRVFGFNEAQLGYLFLVYGVVAMVAYGVGGPLADRFSARKLLAFSLVATGIGGFYMARVPGFAGMCVLFGFWGASTILMFWAPLIRATREWGSHDEQGRAFGFLEGGRGLLAAILTTVTVLAFRSFLPDPEAIDESQRRAALLSVIYTYSLTCFVAAACVWFLVPDTARRSPSRSGETKRGRIALVVKMPAVWLLAVVIICAYCSYKAFVLFPLYAEAGFGWSEKDTPTLNALGAWLRPVAALVAGLVADRVSATRAGAFCFALLIVTYICFAVIQPGDQTVWILWANVIVVTTAACALRAVYYAVLEETSIPRDATGSAVGVVAFFGYTPEVFFAPLAFGIVAASPGATGYQHVFGLLAAIAAVGLVATVAIRRIYPQQ
ncbi:MAG: MFS transporter [Planctomycetes bacterium]|nr:MFS transporter [Planctomycetota bacterium]MBL7043577.1 MFS transporter [Pirellulaceae bacterium]